MATCPKGHDSTATDYCDVCGATMSAPAALAATPAATPATEGVAASAGGPACPECATPSDGRFCEVCGHDFAAPTPVVPAQTPVPAEKTESPAGTPPPLPRRIGAWVIVATADRDYHKRIQALAGPDVEPVPFPAFCPQRRFNLSGEQMLIGRRSKSRGVVPEIDLTGPPEDAGVSHVHAMLVAVPAGGWAVVDLDSANGTYLGDAADPIEANRPVPLDDGATIHVGAWTTLTIRHA